MEKVKKEYYVFLNKYNTNRLIEVDLFQIDNQEKSIYNHFMDVHKVSTHFPLGTPFFCTFYNY